MSASECIQNRLGGIEMVTDTDWKMSRHKATEAAAHAYAPYSEFSVGAAALVNDQIWG
jgi:cytidine deaminase